MLTAISASHYSNLVVWGKGACDPPHSCLDSICLISSHTTHTVFDWNATHHKYQFANGPLLLHGGMNQQLSCDYPSSPGLPLNAVLDSPFAHRGDRMTHDSSLKLMGLESRWKWHCLETCLRNIAWAAMCDKREHTFYNRSVTVDLRWDFSTDLHISCSCQSKHACQSSLCQNILWSIYLWLLDQDILLQYSFTLQTTWPYLDDITVKPTLSEERQI